MHRLDQRADLDAHVLEQPPVRRSERVAFRRHLEAEPTEVRAADDQVDGDGIAPASPTDDRPGGGAGRGSTSIAA